MHQRSNGWRRNPGRSMETGGGFTLLEVIIALVIVALAALGVASGMAGNYVVDREASLAMEAQNLAGQLVEELLVVPFDELITNFNGTVVTNADNSLRGALSVVQVAPTVGAPSLIRIEVTVTPVGDATKVLSRTVTLRSDHSAPQSAWLTGS